MSAEIDIRPVVSAVGVPALVLHRRDDAAVTVEAGRYLAQHVPGAQYVELPGADHLPWVGNAEAILAEIQEFLTGARPVEEPERVLTAVLASRISGAAPLALTLGDRRWLDLLDHFHVIARREIERFRAREVSLSGDSLLASFDGPGRAVRCAEAIGQAAAPLGLDVRAAVHMGEMERTGLTGITAEIAGWMADLDSAGEVLVSSTVKDLVAGSSLTLDERGTYTLPGTADRWNIYALRGSGPVQPMARQAASQLTPREREVAALLAGGLTNRQIGQALVIAEGTAALHVKRILAKLGFSSRAQVAAWAVAQHLASSVNIQN